jgi:hypothetical protein
VLRAEIFGSDEQSAYRILGTGVECYLKERKRLGNTSFMSPCACHSHVLGFLGMFLTCLDLRYVCTSLNHFEYGSGVPCNLDLFDIIAEVRIRTSTNNYTLVLLLTYPMDLTS